METSEFALDNGIIGEFVRFIKEFDCQFISVL